MNDFLYRMAERALGIGQSVRPVCAPLFAPEPPLSEYDPTIRVERGTERLKAESGIHVNSGKQDTTGSADLTTQPLEEEGGFRSPSKPPDSTTGQVEKVAARNERKHSGCFEEFDSPEYEPERTVKNQRITGLINVSPHVRSTPEMVRATHPEQTESTPRSPQKNVNEIFAVVSRFIQHNAQHPSTGLLTGEANVSHNSGENGEQPEETAVIERTVISTLQPAGIRPKSAIYREQPVSPFAGDTVLTPDALSVPSTVHVTIGRIEVRAAQPPLRSQPQSKAVGGTLSLDEYLLRRNGGGR
ncbi:MAG: hypothetical protein ACOYL3_21905 [Desulfuromonadaceae bacterium]